MNFLWGFSGANWLHAILIGVLTSSSAPSFFLHAAAFPPRPSWFGFRAANTVGWGGFLSYVFCLFHGSPSLIDLVSFSVTGRGAFLSRAPP